MKAFKLLSAVLLLAGSLSFTSMAASATFEKGEDFNRHVKQIAEDNIIDSITWSSTVPTDDYITVNTENSAEIKAWIGG